VEAAAVVAFPIAVLIVVLIGVVFERIAIHPLKNPSVLILIMITIAGFNSDQGTRDVRLGQRALLPASFLERDSIGFLGQLFCRKLVDFGQSGGGCRSPCVVLQPNARGKAMRACAHNRDAARLVGISVKQMVTFSFALSAGIGRWRNRHNSHNIDGLSAWGNVGA